MPTGVTGEIYEGDTDVVKFLHRVGRGMGFAIEQRDSDYAQPVKPLEREPGDGYYRTSVENDEKALDDLMKMTTVETTKAATQKYKEELVARQEALDKRAALKARYLAVREKVQEWVIPEELESVRKYALEQLDLSIEHDCGESRYLDREPVQQTGEEWLEGQLKMRRESLKRGREELQKAIERDTDREKHIKLFLESLEPLKGVKA